MQQNIIWTNDTDQIDAIIDDWKQEAAHLATAMAENPKETMADATYGVDVILEKAWKYVVGECELPVPQRLVEAIESIDEYDANVRIAADDIHRRLYDHVAHRLECVVLRQRHARRQRFRISADDRFPLPVP